MTLTMGSVHITALSPVNNKTYHRIPTNLALCVTRLGHGCIRAHVTHVNADTISRA